ncbi:MAG: hypothetical protein DRH30_08845 [Deltaproteobacteria bacterium]|nr:MAG: hypothetical protein DRH30_08845 [Deltaproteobacteria bacterium]
MAVAFSLPAWCGDLVFYEDFESGDTSGWWAPARVGETGQTTCFNEAGTVNIFSKDSFQNTWPVRGGQ